MRRLWALEISFFQVLWGACLGVHFVVPVMILHVGFCFGWGNVMGPSCYLFLLESFRLASRSPTHAHPGRQGCPMPGWGQSPCCGFVAH